MADRIYITSVRFHGYKALGEYLIRLSHMNILVGPNNSGKSTILGAFRVLNEGLRRARARVAERTRGPNGIRPGWRLPETALPISSENIHTNYRDIDTSVVFKVSNDGELSLFFPAEGGCYLFADGDSGPITRPKELRDHLPVDLVIVPILGPLEHQEPLVTEETTQRNILTTRASRVFRNFWHRYPEGFERFAELVRRTWPGMEIERPEILDDVVMFCRENRLSRELYWSGFGFQIWLQLLTQISRADDATLLVVDEPELYLHPDIQRQLLGILRDAGPDILLATHSTEIMSEADPTEILVINKEKRTAERLKDVEGVQLALDSVGSIQNITLTRLARNKRLLFVEGDDDFRLIRRFARKLGYTELAAGTDLTSLESGGFASWEQVRALAAGFENALGFELHVGAVFDRDYWCQEQIEEIEAQLKKHLEFAHLHARKEIENYLLVPCVLERALDAAIQERIRRVGIAPKKRKSAREVLTDVTEPLRAFVQSRYIMKRVEFFRRSPNDPTTITQYALEIFEENWRDLDRRVEIVPGKEVLAAVRSAISELYSVTLTDHRIVSAFENSEVPGDLKRLLLGLEEFRRRKTS